MDIASFEERTDALERELARVIGALVDQYTADTGVGVSGINVDLIEHDDFGAPGRIFKVARVRVTVAIR